jgi:hypothetical protein
MSIGRGLRRREKGDEIRERERQNEKDFISNYFGDLFLWCGKYPRYYMPRRVLFSKNY